MPPTRLFAPGGSGSNLVVGADYSQISGGGGQNLLVALGANVVVNGGAGTNQVVLDGNGDTANLSNGSVTTAPNTGSNVFANGDQITAAAGDLVGVYGGGNTISAQGSDHLVLSGTAGNFDEVSVSNDNPASGSDGGVWLDSNVQANVTGNVDTVAVGTGDSVGVYGASNTVNVGADAFVVIGNTSGGGDAVNASGDMSGGATANGQPTGIAINVGASANVAAAILSIWTSYPVRCAGSAGRRGCL